MHRLFFFFLPIGFLCCHADKPTFNLNTSPTNSDDALFDQTTATRGSMWLLSVGSSFLSETAQQNLQKVVKRRAQLRQDMMNICGISSSFTDKDKEAIFKIGLDEGLALDDKKTKINNLIKSIYERIQKNRVAIKACKTEHREKLKLLLEERNALKEACLIPFKRELILNDQQHEANDLTDEEKNNLSKKLESTTCVDLVDTKKS